MNFPKKYIEPENKYIHSLIKEEENESESIALTKKSKCPLHSLTIKLFCVTCSQSLCIRCLIEHKEKDDHKHKYKDYSYVKKPSNISLNKLNKEAFPEIFSLKTSLQEEFHDQGIKIINEAKERLLEIIEKYFTDLTLDYKKNNHQNQEKKNDLIMSNRKISEEISQEFNREHNNNKKIMINSEHFEEIPTFLKSCIYIKRPHSPEPPPKSSENPFFYKNLKISSTKNPEKHCYLHALLPKFNALFLYDISSETSIYTAIKKKSPFEIPSHPSSQLITNEFLIIFGGFLNNFSEISTQTFRIDLKTSEIRPIDSRTNYAKIANGVYLLDKFLYSIGGKLQNFVRTNQCERLSLETFKWEKITSMKHIRSSPAITAFNRDLYVFFGIDNTEKPCNFIESFKVKDQNWVEVNIKKQENCFIENYHQTSCLQINEDEVFFFGGYKNNDKFEGNDEIILINVKKEEFSKEKSRDSVLGGSQTCNPLINERNEIMCLRYLNKEIGEKIVEFDEMFCVSAVKENAVRIVEVINCRHLEKILKNRE